MGFSTTGGGRRRLSEIVNQMWGQREESPPPTPRPAATRHGVNKTFTRNSSARTHPSDPEPRRARLLFCLRKKKAFWRVASRVRFSASPGESSGSAADFGLARRSEAKSGRAVTERTSLSGAGELLLLILLLLTEVDTNEEIDKYAKQQRGEE